MDFSPRPAPTRAEPAPPPRRRASLVYNPRAGRWQAEGRIGALTRELRREGFDVERSPTEAPRHATEIARRAAAGGAEVLFALGGDGTLREAAAGLLGSETALGPLPGGTTNVVTYSLGLPSDPLAAVRLLSRSPVREIDVGMCGELPFLMQASAGVDADAIGRVSPGFKRRLGKVAVGWTGLGRWWRYTYPEVEVLADGRTLRATFVAVCNLAHYAGRFRLAPAARPDDRRLDLVVFRGRGRAATLAFALDLALGRHVRRDDVTVLPVLPVDEVVLRSAQGVPLQVDGDAVAVETSAVVRLARQRLRVVAPEPSPTGGAD